MNATPSPSDSAPRMPDPMPETTPQPPSGPVRRRWTYIVLILAFAFVLMPFLFWHSTWFGRPLDDSEITSRLDDPANPRETQHALSQVADRIIAGAPRSPGEPWRADDSVRRWYPQIAALRNHPVDEIRLTAAWVMGQDTSSPEFHSALRDLLGDRHPMVRRNAALALARFGDPAGRPELLAMLAPFNVSATAAGSLAERLRPGDVLNPGTLLARIETGAEEKHEVRSPVPGTLERWLVPDGTSVSPDDPIASISPSAEMIYSALVGLQLVGAAEDLPAVERFTRGAPGQPPGVTQQAQQTAAALRTR